MDVSVKLCCSLRWLAGMLTETTTTAQHEANTNRQALLNLLLEPYQDGMLKNDLILSLTDPSLYINAYEVLFPGQHVKSTSFEPLIHSLARKGGYVLEDDTNIVTCSMLAQVTPFREKSHLALLDVLMTQYASKHITMHKMIRTVRRLSLSTFNASKELPSQDEVDLLLILWLNKLSEGVGAKLEEELNRLVRDPDPRQRRRNKTAMFESGGKPTIPPIKGDLYGGVSDGRVLAGLLLHYAPQACTWNDFNLSDQSLSQENITKNFQFVRDYCTTHLPAPGFHLHPEEIMEWGQSGILNANILALLAHLFYCFEIEGQDLAVKKSSSLAMQPSSVTSSSSSVVRPPTQNQSRASLHCASSGYISKPLAGAAAAHLKPSLQSQSAGPLLAPSNQRMNHTMHDPHPRKGKVSASGNSANVQLQAEKLKSNCRTSLPPLETSRTFKAPLRTSLTSFQSKALAAFGKDKYLLTKGALSQSSPLLQVQLAAVAPSNELISVSTDNLHIEKQMRNVRSRSRGARQRNPLGASRKTARSEGTGAEQSEDHGASVDMPDSRESGDTPAKCVETLPVSSAIPISMNLEDSPPIQQVRGSFTLDKQHTFASASAAGLPIINNNHNKKTKLADHVGEIPMSQSLTTFGQKRMNSEAVMLTNLLQLHQGGATYTIATQKQHIPTDVKELRVNLRSFITSLQSESIDMEREAKIQRLKLYQPNKAKSNGNQLSSTSVVVENTATSASEPVVAESNTADVNLNASVSLPALYNPPPGKVVMHLQRNPASSLEQFERDEFLIQLQTSPENLLQTGRGAVGYESRGMATAGDRSTATGGAQSVELPSLQEHQPLSPTASGGQVVIEQTPDSHYSADGYPRAARMQPEILTTNPWTKATSDQDADEKLVLKLKKKELLKSRIEERDRARKIAAEQRAELHKKEEEQTEQKHRRRKGKRKHDVINQHHPHGLEDIPSRQHHAAMELEAAGTIHFQLSAHSSPPHQSAQQRPAVLEHSALEQAFDPPAAVHPYKGPGCYVKPKVKSNVKIIRNAICAVCLAGEVNLALKQKTLHELENATASHVMILFRDTIGFKFRGIYSYNPGEKHVARIYGTGPKEVTEFMISHLYKYNSGQKEFKEIPSRSLSVSMDGFTIKSEYWHSAKRKL